MSDERDREVAAAWRESSRDEPPPALDAAIRAAARRAVGAAPGGRRHRQWRYPAAAAATVAVLAFGIAQMTSRERIEPMIVADQVTSLQKTLPAPAASPSQPVEPVMRPETAVDAKVAAAPAIPAPATKPSLPAPAKQPLRKEAGAAPDRFAAAPAPSDAPNAAAPATSDAPNAAPSGRAADARADAATGHPVQAEPFPSMAQSRPAEAAANRAAKNVAATEEPPATNERAALRTDTSRDTSVHGAAAAAGVASNKVKREQVAVGAAPRVDANDELKAQQAGAQSVAAWITRIRALKDGGQLDAAAKELTRFRSAFGDRADALLPPDLRGVTSSDAKGQ